MQNNTLICALLKIANILVICILISNLLIELLLYCIFDQINADLVSIDTSKNNTNSFTHICVLCTI